VKRWPKCNDKTTIKTATLYWRSSGAFCRHTWDSGLETSESQKAGEITLIELI
jgi:hypothetical protein